MCVAITLLPGAELSIEEITNMLLTNRDGVGLAWATGEDVRWIKSTKTSPEKILKFLNYVKDYPRLLHFRLSTAGGIQDGLCHPFEISPQANYKAEGSGQKVMIHNGHWGGWYELKTLLDREDMLPEGPWSDTRLIAFLAADDEEWLETLGGRVATMDAQGEIKYLGDWQNLREGIRVSNKYWENPPTRTTYVYQGNQVKEKEKKDQKVNGHNAYSTVQFTHKGHQVHTWFNPSGAYWEFWNPRLKKMDRTTAKDPVSSIKEAIDGSGEEDEGRSSHKANGKGGPVCDYVKGKDCGMLVSNEHDDVCTRCPYNC